VFNKAGNTQGDESIAETRLIGHAAMGAEDNYSAMDKCVRCRARTKAWDTGFSPKHALTPIVNIPFSRDIQPAISINSSPASTAMSGNSGGAAKFAPLATSTAGK